MNTDVKTRTPRERILDAAGALFLRDGFRAVGIDTIIAQSGVAKMTLYRHFPSKDDLIVAYLEQSNVGFWGWFECTLNQATSSREKLLALFVAIGTMAAQPTCFGCTFQSAAAEFPSLDHPGHRTALAHKHAVIARLCELAESAGAREPQVLAEQLLLLMDGAFIAARMFGISSPAAHTAAAARALIDAQILR